MREVVLARRVREVIIKASERIEKRKVGWCACACVSA